MRPATGLISNAHHVNDHLQEMIAAALVPASNLICAKHLAEQKSGVTVRLQFHIPGTFPDHPNGVTAHMVSDFMGKNNKIISADLLWIAFGIDKLAEHNVPYAIVDQRTCVVNVGFPELHTVHFGFFKKKRNIFLYV